MGFAAGATKAITPGAGPAGLFITEALGIGGTLVATYPGHSLVEKVEAWLVNPELLE